MSKKITSKLAVVIFCFAGTFFISADLFFNSVAPFGYTGANGETCATTGCHSGNALNTTGGSVVINGIPDTYTPGTTYNFSVAITHGSANRSKWGFAVKAIGSNNFNVGSFTTTNANAGLIGQGEIGHISAPSQSGATYTFNNLQWTAPSTPQSTEQTVRFFAVGNAANGSGSSGDFIYTSTKTITQQISNISESIPEIDKWIVMSASNTATVQLTMKKSAVVQAALYTLSGQEVARISSRQLTSGQHKIQFETGNLAAGTYIVSLISNNRKETKKLLIQQ
jgi:hypothetical protein